MEGSFIFKLINNYPNSSLVSSLLLLDIFFDSFWLFLGNQKLNFLCIKRKFNTSKKK